MRAEEEHWGLEGQTLGPIPILQRLEALEQSYCPHKWPHMYADLKAWWYNALSFGGSCLQESTRGLRIS